ncbi:MAG: NAD-dependent epimerase/dehydratase family protein [Chitinophagaceae bacterium]|nr:MAG: NAD-dependent epimerase/dehydratase family protein [Chitinophagaceae bacterium]
MENKTIAFGGTGAVGRIIVDKLISNGKTVSVLTRQQRSSNEKLTYFVGNVTNEAEVEPLINANDQVVIALGIANSSVDAMSKGTANIISAMKKSGAKRLICLSAEGAGDSWNNMPDGFKNMVLNNELMNASYKDHGIQEDLVKQSNLDWTIVRPSEIIHGPELGTYTINALTDKSKFQISYLDVAQFIVSELEEDKYIKQVAMITN